MGNRCCARNRPVELLRRGREDSSGTGKLLSSTARLSLNLRNPGRVAVVGFALVLAQLGSTSPLAADGDGGSSAAGVVKRLNLKLTRWANYFYLGPVSRAYRVVDAQPAVGEGMSACRGAGCAKGASPVR
jgi:hypothetical protein